MKEFMIGLFAGMVGVSLVLTILVILPQIEITVKYFKAIEVCELNLPRTQHCKIIGVVDENLNSTKRIN